MQPYGVKVERWADGAEEMILLRWTVSKGGLHNTSRYEFVTRVLMSEWCCPVVGSAFHRTVHCYWI